MSELKPCPFCGGEVRLAKTGDEDNQLIWFITRGVKENACRCRVFMESAPFYVDDPMEHKRKLKNELIEAWNRRADDGT